MHFFRDTSGFFRDSDQITYKQTNKVEYHTFDTSNTQESNVLG